MIIVVYFCRQKRCPLLLISKKRWMEDYPNQIVRQLTQSPQKGASMLVRNQLITTEKVEWFLHFLWVLTDRKTKTRIQWWDFNCLSFSYIYNVWFLSFRWDHAWQWEIWDLIQSIMQMCAHSFICDTYCIVPRTHISMWWMRSMNLSSLIFYGLTWTLSQLIICLSKEFVGYLELNLEGR